MYALSDTHFVINRVFFPILFSLEKTIRPWKGLEFCDRNVVWTLVPFYSYFCPTFSFFILVFSILFHSRAGQPVVCNLTHTSMSHGRYSASSFFSPGSFHYLGLSQCSLMVLHHLPFHSHYCQVSVDIIHPPRLQASGCFNVHYLTTSMFPRSSFTNMPNPFQVFFCYFTFIIMSSF